jgi:hypothetical protein
VSSKKRKLKFCKTIALAEEERAVDRQDTR